MKAKWTAVQGDWQGLLDHLGFTVDEEADGEEAQFQLWTMPSGWRVVVEHVFADPDDPDRLAALGEVLSGSCNTIAMGGELRGPGWSVDYDPSREGDEMRTTGAVPAAFDGFVAKARALAAEGDERVDYMFSVPLDLSQAICGYHPEAAPPEGASVAALSGLGSEGREGREGREGPGILGGLFGALFGKKR